MPVCFQLTKKNAKEPSVLQHVDTELWRKFNGFEPEGNTKWFDNWYNTIGLLLACGADWKELEECSPEQKEIIAYLKENYRVNNFRSSK